MLIIEELSETSDVYDLTVENTRNFYGNGILVHNCTEIMLPTSPFQAIDDAGQLVIEHNGKDLAIPNTALAELVDGTTKLVRHVDEDDDVVAFILEDGKKLVLDER